MGVSIRLSRAGRRHLPFYHIDVFDRRARRDGKPVERLGFYLPHYQGEAGKVEELRLDAERATYWLKTGAEPSETVRTLLKRSGLTSDLWSRVSVKKAKKEGEEAKPKASAATRPAELRAKKKGSKAVTTAGVGVKKRKARTANSKLRAEKKAKKS